MDWHKLQQTLFEIDPTDPQEDLRKLQGQIPNELDNVDVAKDYVTESAEIAEGTLGLDGDYSIADFAALAGIVTEGKQKTGRAGQAKGDAPMPKAKPGRTDHPLKDKLVGEGPMDAVKQGFDNYNNVGALKPNSPKKAAPKAAAGQKQAPTKVKGSVSIAQLGKQLGVNDPNVFAQAVMKLKAGQALNRVHHESLSGAFQKLMSMDPQSTNRVMAMLKRVEAATESTQVETDDIKSRLWAALNSRK